MSSFEITRWQEKEVSQKDLMQSIAEKIGCDYEIPLTEKELLEEVDNALDFTMTGMDISEELQDMLTEFEEDITHGMLPNEKKAYLLGIKNAIQFLDQLLEIDTFIFNNGTEVPEENSIGQIISVMRDMAE